MRHSKQGKHSARNPKQAVAIGLSKARREGVDVKPPKKGRASAATRKKAAADTRRGQAKKRAVKKTARKKTAGKRSSR